MRFYSIAAAAATVLAAPVANAATIVQTTSSGNGPAYADGFDSRLGTLTKVTIDSSYFNRFYFKYPSLNGQPVISASGTIGRPSLGLYDFTGNYQSIGQDMYTISLRLSGTAQGVTTTNLESFTNGSRLVLFGALSSDAKFFANGQQLEVAGIGFPGDNGGRFTVTYEYTPAVPEPATWALMLAGFAMTGHALRRRRARIAFA